MDDLNQIIANLTPQDMEMLRGVASSILGDGKQQNSAQDHTSPNAAQKENANAGEVRQSPAEHADAGGVQSLFSGLEGLNFGKADFEMMMKAKAIFDRMNRGSNKNVDLIRALKPHLSSKSQEKADQAMQILRLFEVLPMLKELF